MILSSVIASDEPLVFLMKRAKLVCGLQTVTVCYLKAAVTVQPTEIKP